jgi:ABC-type bacteriocin/lantibiotic exporter with double-glycine peptidase domain
MSRVRTPTVIQMEAVECGAASLAIILAYFGKWVPLEELRIACNVSRDGGNAKDIVVAARTYGLDAKGYRYDIANLNKLRPPYIVFWEFRHFLVVEGFGRGCIYLNDPAVGPRKVTMAEFSDSYTGLALAFKPTDAFERSGGRPGVLGDISSRLRRSRDGFVMLILVSLLLTVPGLAVPAFSKVFIDNILIQGMDEMLRPLLLVMLVTVVAYATMAWLQEWCLMRIETKVSLTGSAVFLSHLLKLPSTFFAQRNSGDLVASCCPMTTSLRSSAGRSAATSRIS